ncbi:MAG: hypothetical protein J6P60_01995, partial [Lachnospiraceae bacterium]|nr:hypothetical protein [Lachnospiraceae bacterium]
MNRKQKKLLIRILSSLVLVILLILLPLEEKLSGNAVAMQNDGLLPVSIPVGFWLYLIPYLVIGYDILKKAWKGIRNRQVFDENFL